ncbi:MAG: hypothetical protein GF331_17290 [Chitinivibrionales bacterium]|nr:hypothetical protein [Chitinivibrionales bacterium]
MTTTRTCARALLAFTLVAVTLAQCTRHELEHAKHRFYRMSTVTEVTVVMPRNHDPAPVWRRIDSLLASWEQRFSSSGPQSEPAALNACPESTCTVSPTLARMLHDARRFGEMLDGRFDPTVLPLKELWGLGEDANLNAPLKAPSEAEIAEVLEHVDYRAIEVDTAANVVFRSDPDVRVDIGGIAKGYALARTCALLEEMGFHDYLVSAGGDVAVAGSRADGRPWLIGIQHPREPGALLATVPLDSGTIVTSGDYERFRMIDGQRVHHLFDPRTGRSCDRNLSVTVWAPDAVEADVLSTGLFCMEADAILAFVSQRPHLECIVVDHAGRTHVSDGWRSRVQLR